MRYILILFTLLACSRNVNAQIQAKQIRVDSTAANPRPLDSLYIMGNDTTTGSNTFGLGKWYNAFTLVNNLAVGDYDWLKLDGATIPNNTDSMKHDGYTEINLSSTDVSEPALRITREHTAEAGVPITSFIVENTGEILTGSPNYFQNQAYIRLKAGVTQDAERYYGFQHYTGTDDFLMGVNRDGVFIGYDSDEGKHRWWWEEGGDTKLYSDGTGLFYINQFGTEGGGTGGTNIGDGGVSPSTIMQIGVNDHDVDFYKSDGFTLWSRFDESVNTLLIQDGGLSLNNIGSASHAFLNFQRDDTNFSQSLYYNQAGQLRWNVGHSSGADGDYWLLRYTGAGALQDIPFSVKNSNGGLNLGAYPISGTPFRLLATESDDDVISPTWQQVADSVAVYSVGDNWGTDVVNHDLTLTGNGTVATPLGVDTSEIATQYDLTTVSGTADHDWYERGTTSPPNAITDNMFHTGPTSIGTDDQAKAQLNINFQTARDTALSIKGYGFEKPWIYLDDGQGTGYGYVHELGELNEYNIRHVDAVPSIPFVIEANTPSNTMYLVSNGNVIMSDYPNTRDDGSPTNVLGTDGSGTIQSYPAGDLLFMYNWNLAASGTGGVESVTDNETVTFVGGGINTATRSTNNVTITGTEVDGSTTNETNTIEEDNSSEQTGNLTLDFQRYIDSDADGGTEVNISLDMSESQIDGGIEGTEYFLIHDSDTTAGNQIQRYRIVDLTNEIVTFEESNALVGTGNTIDAGEGLDFIMSPANEANLNWDASEFQIDGTGEGTEYVLIHDADTTAGHQTQRRLVSAFGGADGNGIYSGDGTTPADVDVTMTDNIDFGAGTLFINDAADRVGISTQSPGADFHIVGAQGSMILEPDAAGGTATMTLEGKADGSGSNAVQSSINFDFTDTDHSTTTQLNATQLMMRKESDLTQWTTFQILMPENTDANVFVSEKNLDFSGNTTESHISMNGGIAFTQNFEFSTASDLSLDRSYYNIIATGGTGAIGDEILLPNVASESDNWDSALTSSDVQVGQTFVITNMRTTNSLVIRTNTGDYLNPTAGAPTNTTLTLLRFDSVILKCVHLDGTTGYWFTYD